MKTKDNSKNREKNKYKAGHENQNIRVFNHSQFIDEDEFEKKKDKRKKKEDKKDR